MKNLFSNLATLLVLTATLFAVGCGGTAKTKLDTSELSAAFASADAALKTQVDDAAKALNGGKLQDGAAALAKMTKASNETLTEPQKAALISVVTQIQTLMSEDDSKMDLKVYQATTDIMASLEGRDSTPVGVNLDRIRPAQPAAE